LKKINWNKIKLKELAGFISKYLSKNNIDAILVGGACVSIYTENKYQSYDLNYVSYSSLKDIKKVLLKLGFKPEGRIFSHTDCPYVLDFVAPPVSIGNKPVKNFNKIKTKYGEIKLLTPLDSIKDRIAAYIYWNDQQSLKQAYLIYKNFPVNLSKIKGWLKNENQIEKYEYIKKFFTKK